MTYARTYRCSWSVCHLSVLLFFGEELGAKTRDNGPLILLNIHIKKSILIKMLFAQSCLLVLGISHNLNLSLVNGWWMPINLSQLPMNVDERYFYCVEKPDYCSNLARGESVKPPRHRKLIILYRIFFPKLLAHFRLLRIYSSLLSDVYFDYTNLYICTFSVSAALSLLCGVPLWH